MLSSSCEEKMKKIIRPGLVLRDFPFIAAVLLCIPNSQTLSLNTMLNITVRNIN